MYYDFVLWLKLFATVPNSRIYLWESWFIFDLQKSKHISHTDHIQQLVNKSIVQEIFSILDLDFLIPSKSKHHNLYTHFIHTWSAIPCSTSLICPSWPCPRVKLNPLPACSYLVSSLFVLAHPSACYLSQRFIFYTCTLP